MKSRRNRSLRLDRPGTKTRKPCGKKTPRLGFESLEDRQLLAADFYGALLEAPALSEHESAPTAPDSYAASLYTSQIGISPTPIGPIAPIDPLPPPPPPPPFDGTAELGNGRLLIKGTGNSDNITIDQYTDATGVDFVRVTMKDAFGDVRLQKIFAEVFVDRIVAYGYNGSDTIVNNTGITSDMYGGNHNDTLIGGWGNDILMGYNGNDRLEGRGGDDILKGFGDDDTYVFAGSGYLGHDTIDSRPDLGPNSTSAGSDTIDFSGFSEPVVSWYFWPSVSLTRAVTFSMNLTDQQDVNSYLSLTVDSHRTVDDQFSAIDTIIGTKYDDTLIGNQRGNRLLGLGGNDTLFGLSGDDELSGGDGNDTLYGSSGNDTLNGGRGDDHLSGSTGDDTYAFSGSVNLGVDVVTESSGKDTFDFSGLRQSVYANLTRLGVVQFNTLAAVDFGGAIQPVENVLGTNYNDIILGNNFDNRLLGGGGNDVIFGYDGNDGLFGGSGDDWLDGGAGNDGLYSGVGAYDRVYGRAGVDRFHVHEDYDTYDVTDRTSGDVQINYRNGSQQQFGDNGIFENSTYKAGNWQDRDVERIDQALEKMQRKTNNAALLMTPSGGAYLFVRQGKLLSGSAFSGLHSGSTIYLTENAFDGSTDSTQRTVFHEIGHSWDLPGKKTFAAQFRALSGWTNQQPSADVIDDYVKAVDRDEDWWYLKSAGFVSNYAMSNPREDFAETVEAFFAEDSGLDHNFTIDSTTQPKLDVVENWLASIATRSLPWIIAPSYPGIYDQVYAGYAA